MPGANTQPFKSRRLKNVPTAPSSQGEKDCRTRNPTNLTASGRVLVAGAGCPAPAFAAPRWGGAGEAAAVPWGGGRAAGPGTWAVGRPSRARRVPWGAPGGRPSLA
jgi:hypothetical protein